MLNYILKTTGKSSVVYLGHSQGTTQMFASLSDPATSEYVNSKISKFVALAPVTYLSNNKIPILYTMALNPGVLLYNANLFNDYLLFPAQCQQPTYSGQISKYFCKYVAPIVCNNIYSLLDPNRDVDNTSRQTIFNEHAPAGSSVMNFVHYLQMVGESSYRPKFKKFNYGYFGNMKAYGQSTPPVYDFGRIRTKIRMFSGSADILGDPTDVGLLYNNLKEKGVDVRHTVFRGWGHMTFVWAENPSSQFERILAAIREED